MVDGIFAASKCLKLFADGLLVADFNNWGGWLAAAYKAWEKRMRNAQNSISGKLALIDNGGRRFGHDRRIFSYNGYLPERRSGNDRRTSSDRRKRTRYAQQ